MSLRTAIVMHTHTAQILPSTPSSVRTPMGPSYTSAQHPCVCKLGAKAQLIARISQIRAEPKPFTPPTPPPPILVMPLALLSEAASLSDLSRHSSTSKNKDTQEHSAGVGIITPEEEGNVASNL